MGRGGRAKRFITREPPTTVIKQGTLANIGRQCSTVNDPTVKSKSDDSTYLKCKTTYKESLVLSAYFLCAPQTLWAHLHCVKRFRCQGQKVLVIISEGLKSRS